MRNVKLSFEALLGIQTNWIGMILILFFCSSCGGTKKATTRTEKEMVFKLLMGFSPSEDVVEIDYQDRWGGAGVGSSRLELMRFTLTQESLDEIRKDLQFKSSNRSIMQFEEPPSWWLKTKPKDNVIYRKTADDSPEEEGFQFEQLLLIDELGGWIYCTKSYWG